MFIGACVIRLHLPENHSLKEKRHVLKSIITRTRNEFGASVAEVGSMDLWQIAEIGACYVSNDAQHAAEVIAKVVNFVERSRLDVVVAEVSTDVIEVF